MEHADEERVNGILAGEGGSALLVVLEEETEDQIEESAKNKEFIAVIIMLDNLVLQMANMQVSSGSMNTKTHKREGSKYTIFGLKYSKDIQSDNLTR